jgi:hypothetical protein
MTVDNTAKPGAGAAQLYGSGNGAATSGGRQPTNLGDILERVLDKGLVIASLDTAREVGINWWENDPWLSADAGRRSLRGESVRGEVDDGDGAHELREENRRLRGRIRKLESGR